MEKDCGFTNGDRWFRYRAAAIIIENECVLLASNDVSGYYYSVGGGVHMGETAEAAVEREVFEETGVHYDVDRLAFIHENFFNGDGVTEGLKCHEIAFFFLMKPRGTQELHSDSYCSEGKEYMNWIPLKDLHKYKAFPEFFRDRLYHMGDGIEHIITRDDN